MENHGKRNLPLLLLTLLGLLLNSISLHSRAEGYTQKSVKKVLFINSYHQGYSWSDDIERGVIQTIHTTDLNVELSFEYLDSQRFPSQNGYPHISELMKRKYPNYHPDLVITSDNNAFHFAYDHRQELFADAPIVFVGYNNFDPNKIGDIHNMTGVNESLDPAKTVALALSMFPNSTDLAILVSSQNKSDSAHRTRIINTILPQLEQSTSATIHLLDNVTVEQAVETMARLPATSPLFVFGRTADKRNDRHLSPVEGLERIAEQVSQPIFGTWSFQLGRGIVGGELLMGQVQGQIAGQMAVKILTGTPASNIPILMNTPLQTTFDAREIQHFGFTLDQLPSDAVIINHQIPLWRQHLWIVLTAVGLIAVESALIFYLLVVYRQRQQAVANLEQHKHTLEDKVRERTQRLEKAKQELEILSDTDGLTELYNRRYLEKQLNIELKRAHRQQSPLSLILIDIDYFKKYNDTYGHVAGDHCLKQIASVLQQACQRASDVVARYGGEEFAILLPDTPSSGAEQLIKRLQASLQAQHIAHRTSSVAQHVTMSLGSITYLNCENILSTDQLFSLADQRLYQAKQAGRNGYICAEFSDREHQTPQSLTR